MKNSFANLIFNSFLKIKIIPSLLITITISIILWIYKPDLQLPLKYILPIILILLFFIVTLFVAAYESHYKAKKILPKVILGREISSQVICLLEPSVLFSYDALVSFYYNEDFEQFFGYGKVTNIQEDDNIQVALIKSLDGYDNIIRKITQNDSTILSKIIIKPIVQTSIQPYLISGGE